MEILFGTPAKAKAKHLPWAETLLLPIGDVQYAGGGKNDPCAVDRLKRWIEEGLKHPNVYFLGLGDYIDVASPSNRARITEARLYDSVRDMMEDAAAGLVAGFLDIMKGTEGRWLGLLEGHHYFEFEDGTTTDTRIAQALKAPFLGDSAMIKLLFADGKAIRTSSVIWCHHGVGGGLLTSAPLNRLEHVLKSFDADIYLIGHHHKKVAAPMDRVYVRWDKRPPKLEHKTAILACTGGWIRSYLQGHQRAGRAQGIYVEQKMLSPTALGGIKLWLRPRGVHSGDRWMETTVEQ